MPTLTNLAAVVRAGGLKVTEVPGWQTRGHRPFTEVRGVVCHHTAGAATGNYPSLAIVRDGRSDLPGPLAQLGLARDGSVLVIASGVAFHAGEGDWSNVPANQGNDYLIGIEAESTGTGDWTTAQRRAYPKLCAALCKGYGIQPRNVIGHKEYAPSRKIDPVGIDMDRLRSRVREILSTSAAEARRLERAAAAVKAARASMQAARAQLARARKAVASAVTALKRERNN